MFTKDELRTGRKNAVWAGVFYIIATAAPSLSVVFSGFLGGPVAGELVPDYLIQLSANENQMIVTVLIELVWAMSVLGIVITLHPMLKRHNETLTYGFSSFRFVEAISVFFYCGLSLSLLTLGQEYATAGLPESSHFQTMGNLFLAAREWTFLLGCGIVWSTSALLLNVLLLQKRLIPRWLSVWGIVGAGLSLVNYAPQFFGIASIEMLFVPIAVQEMVFALWLIFKGFDLSAIESKTAESAASRMAYS